MTPTFPRSSEKVTRRTKSIAERSAQYAWMLGRAASPVQWRPDLHTAFRNISTSVALDYAMPTRADWFRLKVGAMHCIGATHDRLDRRQQLEIAAAQWLRLAEDAELLDRIKLARERA